MEQTQSRFEFRAWANDFGDVEGHIHTLGAFEQEKHSQEIYLVAFDEGQYNIKIRDRHLDIKRLIRVRRGLEQYQPCLKPAFPLTGLTLEQTVLPVLNINRSVANNDCWTIE